MTQGDVAVATESCRTVKRVPAGIVGIVAGITANLPVVEAGHIGVGPAFHKTGAHNQLLSPFHVGAVTRILAVDATVEFDAQRQFVRVQVPVVVVLVGAQNTRVERNGTLVILRQADLAQFDPPVCVVPHAGTAFAADILRRQAVLCHVAVPVLPTFIATVFRCKHQIAVLLIRFRQSGIDGVGLRVVDQTAVTSAKRPFLEGAVFPAQFSNTLTVHLDFRTTGHKDSKVVSRTVGVRRNANGRRCYVVYDRGAGHIFVFPAIYYIGERKSRAT